MTVPDHYAFGDGDDVLEIWPTTPEADAEPGTVSFDVNDAGPVHVPPAELVRLIDYLHYLLGKS